MLKPFSLCFLFTMGIAADLTAQENKIVYNTPANWNDFEDDPEKAAEMAELWNLNMSSFVEIARAGNPWTGIFDAPRDNYVDLANPPSGDTFTQPITWTAFPNKVNWYFHTSQGNPYQLDANLLYPLVDTGRLDQNDPVLKRWITLIDGEDDSTLSDNLDQVLSNHPEFGSSNLVNFAPVKIPSDICPVVNWDQDPADWTLFNSNISGPRGWKDEYNEWVVSRDDKGNIKKINFTSENPEYWFTLWNVDPNKVLELYRDLVSDQVQIEDLYMRNADGDIVNNYNDLPAYNPLNKWNYGNLSTGSYGGAVHLTSPPNTVGAEIYLGAAATILRNLGPQDYSPAQNLCASLYGGPFRNSDPNIGLQANQANRNLGKRISLTDPIALYMQRPDFSNYVTPDGTDASEFFKVVRGRTSDETGRNYDEILHATFEVPASFGYTVSDIKIDGRNILYGAQIAETFNQALAATVYLDADIVDNTYYPPVGDLDNPNGGAQQPITLAVYEAVNNSQTISAATVPILPPVAKAGESLKNMAMITYSGAKGASIEYVGPDGKVEDGIKITRQGAIAEGEKTLVGKHGIYDVIVYKLSIDIAQDVPHGIYGVRVTNPGNLEQIPSPGNLIVLSK